MNSIWNNNITAFKNRFPSLFDLYSKLIEQVANTEPDFWCITQAKNGSLTIEENKVRLHSSYNPEREAQSAVNTPLAKESQTGIFLGFGAGYQVIEWAKNYNQKKLILIEPDPRHFFYALKLLDWTEVFRVPKLVIALACPENDIFPLLEQNQNAAPPGEDGLSQAFILNLPAFTKHAAPYFENINHLIERNLNKDEINAATYNKFAKLWIRNSIKNLDELSKCAPINSLPKQSNKPFLIIAAGPSLQKILPELKELKKRMIIIAVETALKALLRYSIEPDFIVLSDPQYWAYRHISGLHSPSSILITELSVYPAVFRFDCKKIALCSSNFPVGRFFENKTGLLGDLGAGGSVASAAWNLAVYLGAKTIYTAGLDLSFPKKQTHIKGSSAEQTFHTVSSRLHSAEKSAAQSMFSANPVEAENYEGEKVTTDSRMKMFAWWFESRLAALPEITTYTLCKEGLKIPGFKTEEPENLLKLPELKERIDTSSLDPKITKEDLCKIKAEFEENLINLKNLVQNIISDLKKQSYPEKEINALIKNPLYDLVKIAVPSKKELEKAPLPPSSESPLLAKLQYIYTKCANDLALYQ